MNSYKDLLKQREELERQILDARKRELSDTVTRVRGMITEYGLTPQDVFPVAAKRGPGAAVGQKVAPKYRHPDTGATWTGRGKAPKWIEGQDRSKYTI